MSDKSAIEWTDATWNTVYGCDKVSPGCASCYIERTPPYRMAGLRFERGRIPVRLMPERLDVPLRWRKPRRIFVNSLSDTFHQDVPNEFLDRMFATMALAEQHTFLVLTKRPERMRHYLSHVTTTGRIWYLWMHYGRAKQCLDEGVSGTLPWPLPNVWLGVTAENQRWADERIPKLLDTPAAKRFVSVEPMLGPVDLQRWLGGEDNKGHCLRCLGEWGEAHECPAEVPRLDWVIAGGESAGPKHRRLVQRVHECVEYDVMGGSRYGYVWYPTYHGKAWAGFLRDQCLAAGVAFHFKQWGGPAPKSGGRLLFGREWNEAPA